MWNYSDNPNSDRPPPPTHINFAKTPYERTDSHTDLKFGMWHHSDNPNSDFYDLLSILIIIKNVFMISFLKRRFWLTECDWKWWKIVIFHKLLQQKWWFYYVTLKIFKFSLFLPVYMTEHDFVPIQENYEES